jgi:hypothetical protein
MRVLFYKQRYQQPVHIPEHPFKKHPATPAQFSLRHGRVAVAGALAAAFVSAFFALCFVASCFGAACADCADGSTEDGADAASAAQAGTTIKANNSSNKFFMIIPLMVNK